MRWAPLILVSLFACGDDSTRNVPFRPEPEPSQPTETEPPAFEPQQGQVLPANTPRVDVEGVAFQSESHDLRALLAYDLDSDGDRDALVLAQSGNVETTGEIALLTGHRDARSFEVSNLGSVPLDEGCEAKDFAIRTVSPTFAIAEAKLHCEHDGQVQWLLELASPPRVRETIIVHPNEYNIAFTVDVQDIDGDQHDDVVAAFVVAGLELQLKWHDRPGGLAREPDEPTATLERVANDARTAGVPEAALRSANQLQQLHRTFCRSDEAILQLGASRGLQRCPAWDATAAAVRAAAKLKQGALAEAVAETLGVALSTQDRALVDAAAQEAAVDGLRATMVPRNPPAR